MVRSVPKNFRVTSLTDGYSSDALAIKALSPLTIFDDGFKTITIINPLQWSLIFLSTYDSYGFKNILHNILTNERHD